MTTPTPYGAPARPKPVTHVVFRAHCPACDVDHDEAWAVGRSSDKSTQRSAPVDLAEDEGAADHLPTTPEGG